MRSREGRYHTGMIQEVASPAVRSSLSARAPLARLVKGRLWITSPKLESYNSLDIYSQGGRRRRRRRSAHRLLQNCSPPRRSLEFTPNMLAAVLVLGQTPRTYPKISRNTLPGALGGDFRAPAANLGQDPAKSFQFLAESGNRRATIAPNMLLGVCVRVNSIFSERLCPRTGPAESNHGVFLSMLRASVQEPARRRVIWGCV